jgi:twitching motility protein PilI
MENTRGKSLDLVDFQRRLNASLDSHHDLGELSSLLGFVSAGENWLLNLADLHEIESVPLPEKTQHLALARSWVLGISNFKGNIYTLVDFQMFLGKAVTPTGLNARSLLIHGRHQIQTALVVGEVSGLISTNEIKKVKSGSAFAWVSGQFQSADGKFWNMIDVGALASDAQMLNISV